MFVSQDIRQVCKNPEEVKRHRQGTDRVQVVLKVSQDTDVEGWNPLFVHYILAFEEGSAQLLKLLQTFCHVTNLHGVADGLNDVGQFLKPVKSSVRH